MTTTTDPGMGDATALTAFDRDTAVEQVGDGAFTATIDSAQWGVPRGPNGGYIAAIVLRAMEASSRADRPARSLTLHYLRPPADGPVRLDVRVERAGRSLTTLSARMSQDGRDLVLALGAFAGDFPTSIDYAYAGARGAGARGDRRRRAAPEGPARSPTGSPTRPVFGGKPFSEAGEALTGGWLALARAAAAGRVAAGDVQRRVDARSPFARLAAPVPAPTVDLTIHFRDPAAPRRASAPAIRCSRASTRTTSAGGFFEEDGEMWSRDGVLLAQSRQLALLFPTREDAA